MAHKDYVYADGLSKLKRQRALARVTKPKKKPIILSQDQVDNKLGIESGDSIKSLLQLSDCKAVYESMIDFINNSVTSRDVYKLCEQYLKATNSELTPFGKMMQADKQFNSTIIKAIKVRYSVLMAQQKTNAQKPLKSECHPVIDRKKSTSAIITLGIVASVVAAIATGGLSIPVQVGATLAIGAIVMGLGCLARGLIQYCTSKTTSSAAPSPAPVARVFSQRALTPQRSNGNNHKRSHRGYGPCS